MTANKDETSDTDYPMIPDPHLEDTDYHPHAAPLTATDWLIIAGGILAVAILAGLAVVWGCHSHAPRGLQSLWSML